MDFDERMKLPVLPEREADNRHTSRNARRQNYIRGLCVWCGAPAYPYTLCGEHRRANYEATVRKQRRYEKNGLCCRCGREIPAGFSYRKWCPVCVDYQKTHKAVMDRVG